LLDIVLPPTHLSGFLAKPDQLIRELPNLLNASVNLVIERFC
jgi:hypothetical protein